MPKITFIGAGSTIFAYNLIGDILGFPELAGETALVLRDIDEERLGTIPVLLEMARDMAELCPDVRFFNHANPMAINCGAWTRATKIKIVGL